MAAASKRLYESPQEGSFVDLLYDDLTNVGSGIRILAGTGLPLQVSVTYLGVTTTRTYAPGSDNTWLFLVAPTVIAGVLPGITALSVQHSPQLIPSVSSVTKI